MRGEAYLIFTNIPIFDIFTPKTIGCDTSSLFDQFDSSKVASLPCILVVDSADFLESFELTWVIRFEEILGNFGPFGTRAEVGDRREEDAEEDCCKNTNSDYQRWRNRDLTSVVVRSSWIAGEERMVVRCERSHLGGGWDLERSEDISAVDLQVEDVENGTNQEDRC